MNKLLHADFARLRKNKGAWIGLGFIVLFCCIFLGNHYRQMVKEDLVPETERLLFQFLTLTGVVLAAVLSLFVGIDYRDGTIRNKIVAGCRRRDIYLSGFITCTALGVVIYLAGLAVNLGMGTWLFGAPDMELSMLLLLMADGLLLHVAMAAVFHLISVLVSRREYSAVACILLIFTLLLLGSYLLGRLNEPEMTQFAQMTGSNGELSVLSEKNPRYISGREREIYQFFVDLLPSGQAASLASMSVIHPVRMLLCSLGVTAVCVGSGLWLFGRKDIK